MKNLYAQIISKHKSGYYYNRMPTPVIRIVEKEIFTPLDRQLNSNIYYHIEEELTSQVKIHSDFFLISV